ncbi:DeoR family transcriptional regulator, glycerol-3-phosphate regulon repressor [Paracoccus isoporae]|uniref:DeoR family transcriptional regulator, glycerol-3-phosphate regulon repressor n=1 Tax=Paracoccus isoporae TaxID=591205 RepID=A0A1G7F8E4_9RHOB|nr:DeoR/GlpR family DNA-binding transcription regulator [Paracoccus isoporae]SDE72124.1 DeoR family transcriptional regulator, glycerol-3-phosphate regulon repressor [Paracoccus isoporae]
MKPRERRLQIETIIQHEGSVSVETLADRFRVSTETIRRDLVHLAEAGRVMKFHGGARSARLLTEPSMTVRAATAGEEKLRIGRRLADAIDPGATLFIDTGSTTLAAAPALAEIPGLTVITNSCNLADTLSRARADMAVHLLGGLYRAENAQTVGPSVLSQIDHYQADHCVLTVAALSAEIGAMDASHDEAQIARAMLGNAQNLIVLADSSKLERRAAFTVCRSERIDLLITDDRVASETRSRLAERNVRVWT